MGEVKKLAPFLQKKSIRAETLLDYEKLDVLGVSNQLGITKTSHKKSKDLSKYLLIEPGDFAYNPYRINVGSIGLVADRVRGLVSPAYVVFSTKENLLPELLLDFLKSNEGLFQISQHARGTVRKALRFDDLCKIEMPVPSLDIQHDILKKKVGIQQVVDVVQAELIHQQTLLNKLRQAILQEAIEGKLTAEWRAKNNHLAPAGHPSLTRRGDVELRLNNLPHLKKFRKELRNNLTPAEAKLWTRLKGKQLDGRKFRRQHSVGNYILDFYCPAEKLAIELDGEVHNSAQAREYDRERDLFLAHTGIKVIRFENKVVFQNPQGLLDEIRKWFGTTPPLRGTPPLQGGELKDSSPDKERWLEEPEGLKTDKGRYPAGGEGFEPAAQLLARIRTEKAQLVKDKKIRKQKPLPPITPEEIPFELPDGWVWCRLGDVILDIEAGKSPNCFSYPATLENWGVIKISAVSWGHFLENENKQLKPDILPFRDKEIKENDFIMTRANTSELVAKSVLVEKVRKKLLLNDKTLRVNFSEAVSKKYLYYFNNGLFARNYYSNVAKGTSPSMKNITRENIKALLLPLPPLAEQQAIVAKVENLLAVVDELAGQNLAAQGQAGQLMQAVLKEAFAVK